MRIVLRIVAASALLAIATATGVGCSAGLPDEAPGITGTITSLQLRPEAYGASTVTMLVEGGEQPTGAVSDKASVTVSGQTSVFDSNGTKVTLDKLQEGQLVEVWFSGPVAESYPVQGTAAAVRILR